MNDIDDKDTRFFLDLDLLSGRVLGWDYGNRFALRDEAPVSPFHHRVYISRGQFNKLELRHREAEAYTRGRG